MARVKKSIEFTVRVKLDNYIAQYSADYKCSKEEGDNRYHFEPPLSKRFAIIITEKPRKININAVKALASTAIGTLRRFPAIARLPARAKDLPNDDITSINALAAALFKVVFMFTLRNRDMRCSEIGRAQVTISWWVLLTKGRLRELSSLTILAASKRKPPEGGCKLLYNFYLALKTKAILI